jgi:hypothetical protein
MVFLVGDDVSGTVLIYQLSRQGARYEAREFPFANLGSYCHG